MSSTKFLAAIPISTTIEQNIHKVLVKGRVCDNAQEFSINFANETCKNPENITYHFKWILPADIIVENYKENGEWMDHKESHYNAFDGPVFALEFAFQDDGIYVYLVHGDGRNFITQYSPEFEISEIKSVQVWGDVEKIKQLSFSYK